MPLIPSAESAAYSYLASSQRGAWLQHTLADPEQTPTSASFLHTALFWERVALAFRGFVMQKAFEHDPESVSPEIRHKLVQPVDIARAVLGFDIEEQV